MANAVRNVVSHEIIGGIIGGNFPPIILTDEIPPKTRALVPRTPPLFLFSPLSLSHSRCRSKTVAIAASPETPPTSAPISPKTLTPPLPPSNHHCHATVHRPVPSTPPMSPVLRHLLLSLSFFIIYLLSNYDNLIRYYLE